MSGLLGAALAMALSCGPGRDDSVRLKEGQNLDDVAECPVLFCPGETGFPETETEFCGEMHFDYGWSPPLCLPTGRGVDRETQQPIPSIFDRIECVGTHKRPVRFDGAPIQVYCIDDQ
ncbi:MAG: hypothetical protein ACJ8AT_03390 [Hyalangium sp.]|uniref:hypothetical protein n=1 Tax=Hyalangium sp. TaxID=2028555 RepID=UPI00389A9FAF